MGQHARRAIGLGDVVRAYFGARAGRRARVELSNEDFAEGKCGLLRKSTHGARGAAQNRELECTEMMTEADFSACVIYREQKRSRAMAHGDDFTALRPCNSLDWLRGVAQRRMEMKFKVRVGER